MLINIRVNQAGIAMMYAKIPSKYVNTSLTLTYAKAGRVDIAL
jgi:hypothetical protein